VLSLLDRLLAIPCALLPKRYWQSIDLPVPNSAALSSWLTIIAGFALGIPGFFAYLERMRNVSGVSILEISKAQVAGTLPETEAVSAIPMAMGALAPLTFALFTPLGLFCSYLVASGLIRVAGSYIGEAHGDPILSGADWLWRSVFTSRQQRAVRVARAQLERMEEPDRRYDGEWAGLTGVDFVIVSSRRKPGWDKGTWVTTDDGWFVLGEPFDRPMPNGLRTVYPLTAQTTLEVVRKSVPYHLPPLRPTKLTEGTKKV
jgi:hypothetical protein